MRVCGYVRSWCRHTITCVSGTRGTYVCAGNATTGTRASVPAYMYKADDTTSCSPEENKSHGGGTEAQMYMWIQVEAYMYIHTSMYANTQIKEHICKTEIDVCTYI